MFTHACICGELSSMIENTWKWAAENNKIIKHPISGGEFVDVDVESLSKRIHEEGASMSQTTGAVYEALSGRHMHVYDRVFGSFFFHDMQDTTGSLLDPVENTSATGSTKDPPTLPPAPILSCQFFCMHACICLL